MSEEYKIIMEMFGISFVWIYAVHAAMIFFISHQKRPKQVYQLIGVLYICILAAGLICILKGFTVIQGITSLTPNQQLISGFLFLLTSLVLPMAASSFTIKLIFPERWKKFRTIQGFQPIETLRNQMKLENSAKTGFSGKTDKVMNAQRWRLLAMLILINILALLYAVFLYRDLPYAKRSGLLWLSAIIFPIAFCALGLIVFLFRKYPVKKD
jgi:hypothetical protein